MAQNGLIMSSFHLFVHPKPAQSLLEKHVFDPFLTHFWSQKGPFSRDFGIFHGPKRVATGSKWAKTTCLNGSSGRGGCNAGFHWCIRGADANAMSHGGNKPHLRLSLSAQVHRILQPVLTKQGQGAGTSACKAWGASASVRGCWEVWTRHGAHRRWYCTSVSLQSPLKLPCVPPHLQP